MAILSPNFSPSTTGKRWETSNKFGAGARCEVFGARAAEPSPRLLPTTQARTLLFTMKWNQLTKGETRRVIYVENKDGNIDGTAARIDWVSFSKSGRTVYYRGRSLKKAKGGGIRGNYFDEETGEEYWISGVKKRGSNVHWAKSVEVLVDEDAAEEYELIIND